MFPETVTKVGTENCLTSLTRDVCRNDSTSSTDSLVDLIEWLSSPYIHYPTVFSNVCLLTHFAALLITFIPLTTFAISGAANLSNQHALVSQLELNIHEKMEFLFSQQLVVLHRSSFHSVDQYFYGTNILLVLKHLPSKVILVENEH